MTQPTSKKRKRSPAQQLKRKIARVFKTKRERWAARRNPEPQIEAPPRVRLPGAVVETVRVACGEIHHGLHVVRHGVHVKAIITPCGFRASRAAYNLGGNTCFRAIEHVLDVIRERMRLAMSIDESALVVRLVGDTAVLRAHELIRVQRRTRREVPTWSREELTIAALPKLVVRAAGPDAKVWFEGQRCYVQPRGQEVPSCCVFDTGTWAVGPGPQAAPEVYRALNKWAKLIRANEPRDAIEARALKAQIMRGL